MGAPADTTLKVNALRLNFNTNYSRTDLPSAISGVTDDINFKEINHTFTNGRGNNKVNLQHHSRRRLINATEILNLDGGLNNVWGDSLEYDDIKILIFYNRQTEANRFLEVQFKNERYYIGPTGSRTIIEPMAGGIEAIASSSSSEEGPLTVVSNADITYDFIVLGSDKEGSSSSGV